MARVHAVLTYGYDQPAILWSYTGATCLPRSRELLSLLATATNMSSTPAGNTNTGHTKTNSHRRQHRREFSTSAARITTPTMSGFGDLADSDADSNEAHCMRSCNLTGFV